MFGSGFSPRLGENVWAWLVNEDDWSHRLSHCRFQYWVCKLTRPLTCGVESAEACWLEDLGQSPWVPKPMVPTKESKINFLVHIYKLFSMNDDEIIVEIFTRFINIINNFKP